MIEFSVLVAITVGIVSAIKKAGLNSRYAPIISIIVGLIASFLGYSGFGVPIGEVIMTGFIIGLSASGLYSGVKTTSNLK